jgi:hypothetical protein
MNRFAREPVVSQIYSLLALQTATGNVTGTGVDLGTPLRPAVAIVETGAFANLDAGFIRLEESDNNVTFVRLTQFNPLQQSSRQLIEVHRTKRYLRAVLVTEFEQPDLENPVATSLPLTVFLIL